MLLVFGVVIWGNHSLVGKKLKFEKSQEEKTNENHATTTTIWQHRPHGSRTALCCKRVAERNIFCARPRGSFHRGTVPR